MVSSLDLPGDDPSDFLANIRAAPDLCSLPILGLANTAEETQAQWTGRVTSTTAS